MGDASQQAGAGGRLALQAGSEVGSGRFILIKELGRGGMGVVWLAQDTNLDEQVALKFLPSEVAADPVAVNDLRRETARSHRLTHANIIRIHDFHQQPDGVAFISMEYVDGMMLSGWRLQQAGQVLTWEQLAPLVEQLCAALECAHGEGVIHRDLKPANVMLDRRGRVKLADFGIAAVVTDSISRVSVRSSTGGTLAYMSPQQLRGQRPSPSDDIYALGASLYEMLTGRPPFHSGDITHQVLNEPAVPLAERLLDLEATNPVPDHVAAIIIACLAKDPASRPTSAQAVAEWIRSGTATPGLAVAAASEPASVPSGAPWRLWLGVGSAAALLFVCILWFAFAGKGKPPRPANSTNRGQGSGGDASAAAAEEGHPSTNSLGTALFADKGKPQRQVNPSNRGQGSSGGVSASAAIKGHYWTNSLGMVFVPVPGTDVKFSIWDTRVQDYQVYKDNNVSLDRSWRNVKHSGLLSEGPDHPVTVVSWNDAKGFCEWLTKQERTDGILTGSQSYRLPTDAEWSVAVGLKAESGATPQEKDRKIKGVYPWGTQWPPPNGVGNYDDYSSTKVPGFRDGFARTSPVGSFKANRNGLYDMGGNVWQWCEDWYDGEKRFRILRGGSWKSSRSDALLSSTRNPIFDSRHSTYGFRCVFVGDSSP